jgi:hypothetical protein
VGAILVLHLGDGLGSMAPPRHRRPFQFVPLAWDEQSLYSNLERLAIIGSSSTMGRGGQTIAVWRGLPEPPPARCRSRARPLMEAPV